MATPHTGLTLIDNVRNAPQESSDSPIWSRIERGLGVVGMGTENINEFLTRNITDFNLIAEDVPDVSYHSFGSKKHELQSLGRVGHGSGLIPMVLACPR